ncbi:MAG: hypothetical protein AVDCRST_MAG85-861, partial [uncultured Solirubrobacteraceae bacterium]
DRAAPRPRARRDPAVGPAGLAAGDPARPVGARPGGRRRAARVHRRGGHRAHPEPHRDRRAARPRATRPRGGVRVPRLLRDAGGPRLLPVGADRRPGAVVPERRPRVRRRRERLARRPPAMVRRPGGRRRDRRPGADRARDAAERCARGLGRDHLVHRRPAARARLGLDPPDPRAHPEHLHAPVRPADRDARARRHAAGRRDAGRRLPDARAEGGLGLRPRPAAVQHDHGHERRRVALDLRAPRDLRAGRRLRARVRAVLRRDGADPVRRPGPRGAAADHRGAVPRPAHRRLGRPAVPRAPAARGACGRSAGVLLHTADQPAARDLRPAVRRGGLRAGGCAHRAADRCHPEGDRAVPAPPSRARTLERHQTPVTGARRGGPRGGTGL